MIAFNCPACGERMEIGERMAGEQVQCVECNEWVDVPERRARRRRIEPGERGDGDEGLSGPEWALFTVAFLFVPLINVMVSSIMHYAWRDTQPRKATQINLLGFAIFVLH